MVVKVSKPEINVREKLNELAPRTLTGDEYILNEHSHNGEYIKNGIAMYIDGKHPGCFPHASGGGSGQTVFNIDGYFSDFTNTNVTKSDDGGGSFAFDATADLGIGGRGRYNMYSSTCEAWFKATGAPLNGYHVIMQKNGGYSGAPNYGIRAGGVANASIAWFGHDASSLAAAGELAPVTDQWYHLVSVVDADNRILYAYLNGELVDTDTTLAAGGSLISDQGVNIGTGDGRRMYGRIALARVYNRPLSNGEIRYNYLQSLKRIY